MNRYKEIFESWNKVASLYEDKFMDYNLYNDTYDFICSSLNKTNSQILDIGGGPGNIARYLLAKRPDFKITGIDFAPKMIELAKKNNPSARFAIMDCRQISKLPDKYDGLICGFCLQYLSKSDSLNLISDSSGLLNENGLIYLSFIEGDPKKSGYQFGSSGDRIYFYYHNVNDLTTYLLQNNFSEIKIVRLEYKRSKSDNELHTILTAKKNKNV